MCGVISCILMHLAEHILGCLKITQECKMQLSTCSAAKPKKAKRSTTCNSVQHTSLHLYTADHSVALLNADDTHKGFGATDVGQGQVKDRDADGVVDGNTGGVNMGQAKASWLTKLLGEPQPRCPLEISTLLFAPQIRRPFSCVQLCSWQQCSDCKPALQASAHLHALASTTGCLTGYD